MTSRNYYAKKSIKNYLIERPYDSRDLSEKIRKKFKNGKNSKEVGSICTSDPEIQELGVDAFPRWGLRSEILKKWNEEHYLRSREINYLIKKANSDLNPTRKSEFEFFRSLRDIINEEEGLPV